MVYCRVSSPGQKGDLASQVAAMQQFCLVRGLAVDEWVSEVGGGMNLRRTKFLALKQELVEDLLAIVHTSSDWLFGLRRYEEDLKGADLTAGGGR